MGVVPGVDAGYSFGPAAVVGGKVVNAERKHSNHTFYGPMELQSMVGIRLA